MQALILDIGNAVLVFVLLLGTVLAVKAPNERGSTGIERSRSIVIRAYVVVFARERELVILAVFHFLVAIEGEVPEGAHGNIKTHSEVDVEGQVETETGGKQHGVNQGAARISGIFNAEFAGEFNKGVHEVKGHDIDTRTIDHRHRQVMIDGINNSGIAVPTDGDAYVHEIQGKDQVSTNTEGVSSEGVSFALAIQVPGMAGAHTGRFFARRYVGINLDGCRKQSLLAVERHTDLEPHVQVTTASSPHVVGARRTIGLGMFVVKGQIQAQIHKLVKAHGGVHVARKRRRPVIKTISLAIGGIVTATAQGPSVESDIATRTDREPELAISLGIVLMDTISATLDARLRKREATCQKRQSYYLFHE